MRGSSWLCVGVGERGEVVDGSEEGVFFPILEVRGTEWWDGVEVVLRVAVRERQKRCRDTQYVGSGMSAWAWVSVGDGSLS